LVNTLITSEPSTAVQNAEILGVVRNINRAK
jgi:hypothetical protein